ncbi:uncharacterized protein LOC143183281 [Calliopsis andreniformis]|uniref:uncharacterized protein LOC143183281 n=1 Tax=Calliopsis andreniformis TaxID=337506 RepID=UPI003FCD17D1
MHRHFLGHYIRVKASVKNPCPSLEFFLLCGFHGFLSSLFESLERENIFFFSYISIKRFKDLIVLFIQSCDLRVSTSPNSRSLFTIQKMSFLILYFSCYIFLKSVATADEGKNESRPYEFSFNIVDFQHRYEKKDATGIITGEYGFITADGVYHETGYATDKNGDFIITKMRNRKITSLKDAQEIFKDRPEAARKLVEAVAKACGGCKIPIKQDHPDNSTQTVPTAPSISGRSAPRSSVLKEMTKTPTNTLSATKNDTFSERRGKSLKEKVLMNMINSTKKLLSKEATNEANLKNTIANDRILDKMANDIFYRFNYTITTHDHQENGYRNGKKDGSYRTQNENGIDTKVKYLANEFGHQPNISFVPRTNGTAENHRLKGYSFLWYWT